MDVVVFGATGYLGSHAAEQLMIAGHAVRCIVRPQSDTRFLKSIAADIHVVDFANGDLSALIDEGSCVLNCTADTRMHLSDLQRSKVEIDLTTQIFKAAAGAGAKRFMQLSTVMLYGFDRPPHAIDEQYSPSPKYSYSRIAARRERVLLDLAKTSAMELIVLRPSNTLGKRDTSALPAILPLLEKGKFPVIGGGGWRYSNADARDVGRAFVHLLDLPIVGPEIYLMKAYDISWLDLKAEIDNILGRKSRVLNIPRGLALGLGGVMEFLFPYGSSPPLTRFMVETLSSNTLFDDSKLRSTGFLPKYDLHETLLDALSDKSPY
jgi:nucleoside-diphosphate-sugar epimerase